MAQSQYSKDGKKLLSYALDDFYYFSSDKVEDLLDKALVKFNGQENWKKETRKYLFSFADIRTKICDEAKIMFNLTESN